MNFVELLHSQKLRTLREHPVIRLIVFKRDYSPAQHVRQFSAGHAADYAADQEHRNQYRPEAVELRRGQLDSIEIRNCLVAPLFQYLSGTKASHIIIVNRYLISLFFRFNRTIQLLL